MKNISLDITKAACFLEAGAVEAFEPKIKEAQLALENGTCPGNDFLGWLHLPSSITPEFLAEIEATAKVLRDNCEVVVVAGIGGSYLGARAVIEALGNSFGWLIKSEKNPVILFAGLRFTLAGLMVIAAGSLIEHTLLLPKKTSWKGILTLAALQTVIQYILFYNGGATITVEGSVSLEDLKNMEAQGVTIKTCGTCLDYYNIKDKLAVGTVTNMYDIVETMNKAAHIIRP